MRALFEKSQMAFEEIASHKLSRWAVSSYGGKDGTLTALLAVGYLLRMDG